MGLRAAAAAAAAAAPLPTTATPDSSPTVTASCPGKPDVVTQLNGFLATYAAGNGPFTAGQSRLTGSTEDAATTASWDFSYP